MEQPATNTTPPPHLNGVPQARQSPRSNKPKIIIGITACLLIIIFAVIAIPKLLHNGGHNDTTSPQPANLQASPNWLNDPAVAWELDGIERLYTRSASKYFTVLRDGETQVIDLETGEVKFSFDCRNALPGDLQQIGDSSVLCYNESPGIGAYNLETGEHHVTPEFRAAARQAWAREGSAISYVQDSDDTDAIVELYDPITTELQQSCEIPGVNDPNDDNTYNYGFLLHPSGTAALFYGSDFRMQFVDLETCAITDHHGIDFVGTADDLRTAIMSIVPTKDGWWMKEYDRAQDSYYGLHISLEGSAKRLGDTKVMFGTSPIGALQVIETPSNALSLTAAELQRLFEVPAGDVRGALHGSLGNHTYVVANVGDYSNPVLRHYLDGTEVPWMQRYQNELPPAFLFVDEHHALVLDEETSRLDLVAEEESDPLWSIPDVGIFWIQDDHILVGVDDEEREILRAYTAARD